MVVLYKLFHCFMEKKKKDLKTNRELLSSKNKVLVLLTTCSGRYIDTYCSERGIQGPVAKAMLQKDIKFLLDKPRNHNPARRFKYCQISSKSLKTTTHPPSTNANTERTDPILFFLNWSYFWPLNFSSTASVKFSINLNQNPLVAFSFLWLIPYQFNSKTPVFWSWPPI